MGSEITSVGAYYPAIVAKNEIYKTVEFFKENSQPFDKTGTQVVDKFEQITGIKERRIAQDDMNASEMGFLAARDAISNRGADQETIDYIIVAHNWGNVSAEHNYYDAVPNLAARIKGRLGIKNPDCVAYDILFGCPGWLEAMKQAHLFIKSGDAKKVLVIGTDTVSRVVENCDMDSMLFSDGAGAIILEENDTESGILAYKTVSHCGEEVDYLKMGPSYIDNEGFFLKMEGKKVFRYAMEYVPYVINECLSKAAIGIEEVKYFIIHQANGKMIQLIGKELFRSNGIKEFDEKVLPINVYTMGNNSVATIPTLLHEIQYRQFNDLSIDKGDIVVFASVGAGMHANCIVHRF
jgi:3-oxoacyl-[acyl-carrier-protein] synthase-3